MAPVSRVSPRRLAASSGSGACGAISSSAFGSASSLRDAGGHSFSRSHSSGVSLAALFSSSVKPVYPLSASFFSSSSASYASHCQASSRLVASQPSPFWTEAPNSSAPLSSHVNRGPPVSDLSFSAQSFPTASCSASPLSLSPRRPRYALLASESLACGQAVASCRPPGFAPSVRFSVWRLCEASRSPLSRPSSSSQRSSAFASAASLVAPVSAPGPSIYFSLTSSPPLSSAAASVWPSGGWVPAANSESNCFLSSGSFHRLQQGGSQREPWRLRPSARDARCTYTAAARPRRKVVVIPMETKAESCSPSTSSTREPEKQILLPPQASLRRLSKPEAIAACRSLRYLPASVPRDADYCEALLARTARLSPSLLPIEIRSVARTLVFSLPPACDVRTLQTALMKQLLHLPLHAYAADHPRVLADLFSLFPFLPLSAVTPPSSLALPFSRGEQRTDTHTPSSSSSSSSSPSLNSSVTGLPQRRRRRALRYEALCMSPAQRELSSGVLRHLVEAFLKFHLPLRKQRSRREGPEAAAQSAPASPSTSPSLSASVSAVSAQTSPSFQTSSGIPSQSVSSAVREATSKDVCEVLVCLSNFEFLFRPRDAEFLDSVFKRLGDFLTLRGFDGLSGKGASLVLNAFVLCRRKHNHLFHQIARRLPILAANMTPKDVALAANALARAEVRVLPAFSALSGRAKETLEAFQPQDFSNLLNAFGRLEILDLELFNLAAPEISAGIRDYNPQHLSNIAHAYSKVSVSQPELFFRIAEMTRRSIQNFSNKELANLALAFAKMDIQHKGLLVSLADEVLFRGTAGLAFGSKFHFDLLSLQQLSSAFSRLGLHDPRLFFVLTRLARDGVRRSLRYRLLAGDSEGADTSLVASSASAASSPLKTPWMSVKWRREYEALRESYALNGQMLASLLLALGKGLASQATGPCDQAFQSVCATAILRLEKHYSACAVSQVARACHLLGLRDMRVRRLLVREALPRLPQFPPTALAHLLSSFASLQLYHAVLIKQALQTVALHLAAFSAAEVATIVVALEKLGYRDRHFLRKAAKVIHRRRDELATSFLCGVVNACAKLSVDDDILYEALFKDLFSRQHLLSAREALTALYALLLLDARKADLASFCDGETSGEEEKQRAQSPQSEGAPTRTDEADGRRTAVPGASGAGEIETSKSCRGEQGLEKLDGSGVTVSTTQISIQEPQVVLPSPLCSSPLCSSPLSSSSYLESHQGLLHALLRVAYRSETRLDIGSVTRLQIVDLYLRLLRPPAFASLPFDLKAFLARARRVDLAQQDCFSLSSKLHRDVSSAFLRIGLVHRSEVQLGPFSLDIVLGDRLAVEIDGPSHFYRETCMRVASSRLKQRLLREMGWTVLPVSFFEWRQLVTPERKVAYCARFWPHVLRLADAREATTREPEERFRSCLTRGREANGDAGRDGGEVEEEDGADAPEGKQGMRRKQRDFSEVLLCRMPRLDDFLWLMDQQGATVTRQILADAMNRYRRLLAPTGDTTPHQSLQTLLSPRKALLSPPPSPAALLLPPSVEDGKEVWEQMKGKRVRQSPTIKGRKGARDEGAREEGEGDGGEEDDGADERERGKGGVREDEKQPGHRRTRGRRRQVELEETVFHVVRGKGQRGEKSGGLSGREDVDSDTQGAVVTQVVRPSPLDHLLLASDGDNSEKR
ncbi:RAP domain-containing protein [Toxoplasma gondii VAND]|uniref:RAP domain-containing protein n=3 Tax=Toxoplasma gondii TaxID=5811 RepID=A0A086Q4R2_TOXGO|nr:RAP domain-containing protein [Toxoplasma gondii VAND]